MLHHKSALIFRTLNVEIFRILIFKIEMYSLPLRQNSSGNLTVLAPEPASSTENLEALGAGNVLVQNPDAVASTDLLLDQEAAPHETTKTIKKLLMAAILSKKSSTPESLTPTEEGLLYLVQAIFARREIDKGETRREDVRLVAEGKIKTLKQANAHIDIVAARERVKKRLLEEEVRDKARRIMEKKASGMDPTQAELQASFLFKLDSQLEELAEKEIKNEKQARKELGARADEERNKTIIRLTEEIIQKALEDAPYKRLGFWAQNKKPTQEMSSEEMLAGVVLLKKDQDDEEISVARSEMVNIRIENALSAYPSKERRMMHALIGGTAIFEDEETLSVLQKKRDRKISEKDEIRRKDEGGDISRIEEEIRKMGNEIERVKKKIEAREPFKELALRIKRNAQEEVEENISDIEAARKYFQERSMDGRRKEGAKKEISDVLIREYECGPKTARMLASIAMEMRHLKYSPIEVGAKLGALVHWMDKTGKSILHWLGKKEKPAPDEDSADEDSVGAWDEAPWTDVEVLQPDDGDEVGHRLTKALIALSELEKQMKLGSGEKNAAGPSNSDAQHQRKTSKLSSLSAEDWAAVIEKAEKEVSVMDFPMRGRYPVFRKSS